MIIIKKMDKVFIFLKMGDIMMDNEKMGIKMDKEFFQLMVINKIKLLEFG